MNKSNLLGYSPSEMEVAKDRSKYFVAIGLALFLIFALSQNSLDFRNYLSYVSIFGFILVSVVFSQFIALVIRMVIKMFGKSSNRFDYFASTYLILSVISVLSLFIEV